jgi:multimeric flavodoxin WrbA
MKKIFAIIGSPVKTKSNTAAMVRLFLEIVKEIDNSIEYEVIVLGNKTINMCRGCWACTEKGYCIQKDDLNEIQDKMIACDLLILGSPVYVHSVSAQLKAFIDRVFIWYHLMKLMGKPAISAVTTARTGRKPTEKYLKLVLYALGAVPIGSLRGIGFKPGELQNREELQAKCRKLAIKTVKILNGKKALKPQLMNSFFFWGMKMKAKYGKSYLKYEHNYWKEKGWFNKAYSQILKESRRLN